MVRRPRKRPRRRTQHVGIRDFGDLVDYVREQGEMSPYLTTATNRRRQHKALDRCLDRIERER